MCIKILIVHHSNHTRIETDSIEELEFKTEITSLIMPSIHSSLFISSLDPVVAFKKTRCRHWDTKDSGS